LRQRVWRDHAIHSGDAARKNVGGILTRRLILADLGVALLKRDNASADARADMAS
jgi:hypothetical protein